MPFRCPISSLRSLPFRKFACPQEQTKAKRQGLFADSDTSHIYRTHVMFQCLHRLLCSKRETPWTSTAQKNRAWDGAIRQEISWRCMSLGIMRYHLRECDRSFSSRLRSEMVVNDQNGAWMNASGPKGTQNRSVSSIIIIARGSVTESLRSGLLAFSSTLMGRTLRCEQQRSSQEVNTQFLTTLR